LAKSVLGSDLHLVEVAEKARELAYAPYSHFSVGAAVLAESGQIYSGCNIENASFSATLCAERAAIAAAISCGERKITSIAIIADSSTPVRPCGVCRQVILEFGPTARVIAANVKGDIEVHDMVDLFPLPFIIS
jgi:cytidine deaminase